MKNLVRIVVAHVIVLLCMSSLVFGQATTITLLHVNDTHSHLDAVGPKDWDLDGTLGGIAKAATVIGRIRATEENVLLVHGGDPFQGDLFFNKYFDVPELQLMVQLGFDAMAVGNHEFDFGPDVLNGVLTTAFAQGSLPLLSANLDNLQVSGVSFNYDPRQPVGQRVILESTRIKGNPIDPSATYSLTVNAGVVALLDFAGVHAENVTPLPDFEYDVVRDYIASLSVVGYQTEGRIRDVSVRCRHAENLADAASVPPGQGVRLYKNYPNPFNPSTRIAYELPVDSRVSLKVYNTLGQEVATLVNGENSAGRHEVVWDASNVPSGVYFYRLEANGSSAVEKLLLLK